MTPKNIKTVNKSGETRNFYYTFSTQIFEAKISLQTKYKFSLCSSCSILACIVHKSSAGHLTDLGLKRYLNFPKVLSGNNLRTVVIPFINMKVMSL